MQDNSNQKRQYRITDGRPSGHRRGSSPPLQERGEEFADWVGKPLSALKTEGSPSKAPHLTKRDKPEPQSDSSATSDDQKENLEKHRRIDPPDGSGALDAYSYHPSGWHGPPGDDSSRGTSI